MSRALRRDQLSRTGSAIAREGTRHDATRLDAPASLWEVPGRGGEKMTRRGSGQGRAPGEKGEEKMTRGSWGQGREPGESRTEASA